MDVVQWIGFIVINLPILSVVERAIYVKVIDDDIPVLRVIAIVPYWLAVLLLDF